MIPLALYIHTPWCIQKCPYCDFNSHALRGELPEQIYTTTLINELKAQLPRIDGRPIHSVFIGGGTPSLFSARAYERLFHALQQHVTFAPNVEITLEANPGTALQDRFHGFRQVGINRLSIGIQSCQDDKLKALGRIHNSTEAIQSVEIAKRAGFTRINCDLMYGLPQQTINDALLDLKTVLQLQPTHLSWYHLTLEPNTYFYQFPPTLPSDDLIWEMQDEGQQFILDQGFVHYEVSAFSQPNDECQHNLNYWQFGDYLGLGAGAHSKITHPQTGEITRHWNVKNPKDYLDTRQPFIANKKTLLPQELPIEFMMNALRLQKPIPVTLFTERTGCPLDTIQAQLLEAQQKNFLHINKNHFETTPQGKRYLNELLEIFL